MKPSDWKTKEGLIVFPEMARDYDCQMVDNLNYPAPTLIAQVLIEFTVKETAASWTLDAAQA